MYLDNAATSFPKPPEVYAAVDHFQRCLAANPGRGSYRMAGEATRIVQRARQRLARLLDAPPGAVVVWTRNATEALNLALKGLLRPGDRVLSTELEHNSVARPLRALEARGVALVRAPSRGGHFQLEPYLRALETRPRLAVMPWATNVTGELLPVAEVGAACRRLAVPLLVDAAQAAGAVPVSLAECGASLVAVGGHKSLLGPQGTGALLLEPGLDLPPLCEGGTGTSSESDLQPDTLPERLESGTLNGPGLAGLDAALGWLAETGVAAIHRHTARLTTLLRTELARLPGITLHGPGPSAPGVAIVSITAAGWDPSELALALDTEYDIQCRAGLHCAPWAHRALGTAPAGTLRLSPGFFNTDEEMLLAARALGALTRG